MRENGCSSICREFTSSKLINYALDLPHKQQSPKEPPMLQTLVICLFILPFFALIKCVADFVHVWKKEAPLHWQQWEEPEFVDLYRGLFGYFWPVIFGKACEEARSELLIKKRNDIRFVLLIMVLLFIAAISFSGFCIEFKPRWVH